MGKLWNAKNGSRKKERGNQEEGAKENVPWEQRWGTEASNIGDEKYTVGVYGVGRGLLRAGRICWLRGGGGGGGSDIIVTRNM